MSDKQLLSVVQARAFYACILLTGQGTAPALQVEMLRVLVSLPVGFAAKSLIAHVKGAAEWSLVPCLVFPANNTLLEITPKRKEQ